MDFVNPNSFSVSRAFAEPSLASAKIGNSFQFQRLGYFNVDNDSTREALVFNKTVGLRDSWTNKKPVKNKILSTQKAAIYPLNEIMRFGKKYTKFPVEKQQETKLRIQELAKSISYEELIPFFGTALKKVGTRTVTMIALGVLIENNQEITPEIKTFVRKALEDKNELLVTEASKINY
jgi:glutaminyl-tRNA synthetase